MTSGHLVALLRHLRGLTDAGESTLLSDGQLLERYAEARDETAFAALLRRHGGLVWGVCRRVLTADADADDAFQATFLVLLHKAAALRGRDSLAGFLQGVAWRLARKLKAEMIRRRIKESQVQRRREMNSTAELEHSELRALLDEELDRLPEKYRAPLVLCYLEGQSYPEAARQLRWKVGTVSGRLARAREILRQRLSRRGLTISGAALAMALTEPSSAPAATMAAVSRMAALLALGQAAGSGAISTPVAALAQSLLQAMTLSKLKTIGILVVVFGLFSAGAGWATQHFLTRERLEIETAAGDQPEKPKIEKAERTDLYGDPLPPGALLRLGTVRFRNRNEIGQIAYSPNSKILAAGGYGGNIFLYEAATGRILRQIQAFAHQHASLAFAPDGKTLASATTQTLQFWDGETGKELRRFEVQESPRARDYGFLMIPPLVFSHNGKLLAWVAADHSIRILNAQSGKELVKLSGHQEAIHCLAFSADDQLLFSASHSRMTREGSVRVWRLSTGKEARRFALRRNQPADRPEPLCFPPDTKSFVMATHVLLPPKKGAKIVESGYALTFLDLETGAISRKLEPQPGRIRAALFSPDGKTIAALREPPQTGGGQRVERTNRMQIWDAATGKQLVEFPAFAENRSLEPRHLAFSPDGRKLAASAGASALHVWDVARGREDPERPPAHHAKTCCVAYSPDGRTLATGSADHTIAMWDAVSGKQRLCLRGHGSEVASLAFSPDGKWLASSSRFGDQCVRLWDVVAGKELYRFAVPYEQMGEGLSRSVDTWVAFTSNGKLLAAAGTDRKVRLWDVATGKEIRNEEIRGLPTRSPRGARVDWKENVHQVSFASDGRLIAFSIGQTVHLADVAAGQRLFQYEKDRGAMPNIGLSPDGKTMAYVGLGNSFRLVEIASGQDLHRIELPEMGGFCAMTFAPDGRTIALAYGRDQGRIYLFDVPTGKQLLRLQGAASYVNGLAFSPDGSKLASAQNDCTALVWNLAAARRKLSRLDLPAHDLDRLWGQLQDVDAAKAHTALWTLVAAPDQAVPFLKDHLEAVPHVAAERLRRLIADLDADDFARREQAGQELAKLGIEVEPALRKVLQGKPSLEMRRRVESSLKDLSCQTEMTPDALRQLRAIQVLEQIGSPPARQILASLARGAPAAPQTRDAVAALERLRWRSAVP